MAMNRIQIQSGMSRFEFFQQFGTEAQSEATFMSLFKLTEPHTR